MQQNLLIIYPYLASKDNLYSGYNYGSEKPEQVEQNAALLSHTASFTSEQMDEIHTMFKDTSARLLNPATWFNAQK